jgi:LytR cell envelope-related transcriptional attenuator
LLKLIEQIGSFAGLAAFLGLGVFALLSFAQARDIRRLRDWAGSAPERDAERKESTSTVAAQRAEELRALEESRTAERDAVAQREVRRQRREEGLPELTRRERIRQRFSGFGERVAEPKWLAAIFVVVLLIAGGAAYAVINNGNEAGGKGTGTARVAPGEIEVTVLNGTAVPNLAANYGHRLEAKGFKLGAVGDASQPMEKSVVMYKPGHKPEAKRVAKQLKISHLAPMSSEVRSAANGAKVAVVIGEDNAASAG